MSRKIGHLLKYFESQRDSVEDLAPEISRKPSRSAVHKLRIATRRSRAILWVLKHSSPDLSHDRLNHRLRKLSHVLGSVRELDMAIKDARKFKLDPTELKSARKVKMKVLRPHLKERKLQKLSREMGSAINSLRSQHEIDTAPALQALRESMSGWQKRKLHGSTKVHRFRIAIKKVRYALEALGKPVEPLKDIQDLLGKSHDLETLQTFLGKNRAVKHEQSRLVVEAMQLAKPILARVNRRVETLQQ